MTIRPQPCPFCRTHHANCDDNSGTLLDLAVIIAGDVLSLEGNRRFLSHLVTCRACCETFASMVADSATSDEREELASAMEPLVLELGELLDRLEIKPSFPTLVRVFLAWQGQPHHEA